MLLASYSDSGAKMLTDTIDLICTCFLFSCAGVRVFRVEECWSHTQFAYWQIRANFEPLDTTNNTTEGGANVTDGVEGEEAVGGGDVEVSGAEAARGGVDGGVNTGTDVADGTTERTITQLFGDLAELSQTWIAKVRENKCEKYPGHMRDILQSLGPLPPPGSPTARAMWYAALLNPIPALGVAPEIRPAVLAATGDVRQQLLILTKAFRISVEYVNGYRQRVWLSRAFLVLIACMVLYLLLAPETVSEQDLEQSNVKVILDGMKVEVEGTFRLDEDEMDLMQDKDDNANFYEL